MVKTVCSIRTKNIVKSTWEEEKKRCITVAFQNSSTSMTSDNTSVTSGKTSMESSESGCDVYMNISITHSVLNNVPQMLSKCGTLFKTECITAKKQPTLL